MRSLLPEDLGEMVRQIQTGRGEGAEKAAEDLVEFCQEPSLRSVVRRAIPEELRTRYNPNEFFRAKEFLGEIWIKLHERDIPEDVRNSPERLKGYLTNMIRNIVVDILRKQGGWRRKRGREVPLEEAERLSSPQLSPEDAVRLKVLLDERLDELMAQQPAERQAILPLLREQCSGAEIARRLGLERHVVQEVIAWLQEKALE